MTKEQLQAVQRQLEAQLKASRESVLRLEGYSKCISDILCADEAAEAAAAAANQPTPPESENDAQAA